MTGSPIKMRKVIHGRKAIDVNWARSEVQESFRAQPGSKDELRHLRTLATLMSIFFGVDAQAEMAASEAERKREAGDR